MAILTFFDVVEHLITASFGGPMDAEQRDIRTAVHRAYDEFTKIRDWEYYQTHGRILTQPAELATITSYDASTRVLQTSAPLLGAGFTEVRIANVVSEIASGSGSAWTLSPQVKFPQDLVLPNSQATFYRSTYPLPDDFRNMDEPSDQFNWWTGLYLSPDEAMKLERVARSNGKPYHWTILKNPVGTGWAIKLIGYPTRVETIDFTYRRTARPIRRSGHEASSNAGVVSRTTATGPVSGLFGVVNNFDPETFLAPITQFSIDMAGSVLRCGSAGTFNSGADFAQYIAGALPGNYASINGFTFESHIQSVESATSLTLSKPGTIPLLTRYRITDPIDIAPHMTNAFYSCCEYWLSRIRNTGADKAFAIYQRDLRLAFEMEALSPISGRSEKIWNDHGWRSARQPDQGL